MQARALILQVNAVRMHVKTIIVAAPLAPHSYYFYGTNKWYRFHFFFSEKGSKVMMGAQFPP